MAHESALQLRLWCTNLFQFAQVSNTFWCRYQANGVVLVCSRDNSGNHLFGQNWLVLLDYKHAAETLRMLYGMPESTKIDAESRTALSALSDDIWVACRLLLSFHSNEAPWITHVSQVCMRGYRI
jgi:hypothetical protein